MSLFKYFRISKPSADKIPPEEIPSVYKKLKLRTFWGVTVAYSIFYICRMTLSVIKQPLIDGGLFSAGQLGIIGSSMLLVYAFGKFMNGFIADYCNIRRFMAWGLLISSLVNLFMGLLGFADGVPPMMLFILFCMLWGLGGWSQSMGSPPGVISLSRWFPLSERGSRYSVFSATPYLGKFLSFNLIGLIVAYLGWQCGFLFASVCGFAGVAIILFFVSDTPESMGLPTVQELSGENGQAEDKLSTRVLQKAIFRHPGIWVIALSSAFIYITQYAISGWGVLFLQKNKGFSLESSGGIIAFAEAFGIAGTVLAGWLSDKVFKGDRVKPVVISGLLCLASLGAFLFTGGSPFLNICHIAVFSLSIGVLFCIVAGLMALDMVPRKATGAALGIVGISSYIAAGIQDVASGFMIQAGSADGSYDFSSVSIFWMICCLLAMVLPIWGWRHLAAKNEI